VRVGDDGGERAHPARLVERPGYDQAIPKNQGYPGGNASRRARVPEGAGARVGVPDAYSRKGSTPGDGKVSILSL
jgi:hypothetical protein